jgi:type I restriction enzyme M protein
MDASQYKDYVLFMLFIKYVSDKYGDSDDFAPPVTIPPGASFKDMVALKGKSDIGDKINKTGHSAADRRQHPSQRLA